MPKKIEIPLHLFQVLEEEYLNLHGPLKEQDVVHLPTTRAGEKDYRRVIARRDWLFHRGHIKNPLSLIIKLLPPGERARLGMTAADASPAGPAQEALETTAAEAAPPAKPEARRPAEPSRDAVAEYLGGVLAEHLRQQTDADDLRQQTDADEPKKFDNLKAIYDAVAPFADDLDSLIKEVQVPEVSAPPEGVPVTATKKVKHERRKAEHDLEKKREIAFAALGQLEEGLNIAVLQKGDEKLYTVARFVHVTLSDATRLLVQEGTERIGDDVLFTGDDLVQFKRLLLEDVFPEEIEKVSSIRLASVNVYLHGAEQAALCLSGGGIRSGTFALGLLQGLARRNLLRKFHYLSTVSGGGYIGSWLTAWIHRHRDGLEGVTNDLRNRPPDTTVDPDPGPLRYLRRYSNFITPQVGLLTADTWTFIAIYLRNLLLNWFVLIPLLLGWLMLPRLYNSILLTPAGGEDLGVLAGHNLQGRHVLLAFGCLLAVVAIAFVAFNRPKIREDLKVRSPFWYRRTDQRSFLLYCLLPLTVAAVCITIYWAWSREVHQLRGDSHHWWDYPFFGVILCAMGWLCAMAVLRRLPWAALAFAAALAWAYLSGDLTNFWSLLPFLIFLVVAVAEWFIVKRVTHLAYAKPRELNPFEIMSLLLAGLIGGAAFWLAEYVRSPTLPDINGTWSNWTTEFYTCLAVPVFFGGFLLAMTIFVGATSHMKEFTDEDREWWARAGAWILIVVIGWVTFSALVIFGPLGLLSFPKLLASAGGVSGLLALLAGRSSKTPANQEKQAQGGTTSSIMGSVLPLLAAVFLGIFVAALSLLTSVAIILLAESRGVSAYVPMPFGLPRLRLFTADPQAASPLAGFGLADLFTHMWAVHYASFWLALGLMVAFLVFGFVMARLVNLNRFSLHAGYRDRLIRGFLGASRDDGERKPNPFTGFDPLDNVRMHELRPMLLREGDFKNFGQLANRLRLHADPVSDYLWKKHTVGQGAERREKEFLRDDTREELAAYSPDALPSQSLKERLIRDLNGALEDTELPLYAAGPFQPYRSRQPALGIIEWARRQPPELREQYRRSPYAILLNRVLLQMAYPEEIKEKYPPPHRVLHLVNTTLNLVGGDNLAWQQRKAEPFSVTPLHAGCFRLGYRDARFYGDEQGIKLGTAMAVSGAAASSNMGYYTTSPVLSMVLTLFNVRLGWWLGNPGPAGQSTYRRQSPKYSVAPVLAEAFGLTDDRSKYVYLTDGGHFENLAFYEMVLRRCRLIIVSDAAADADYQFEDLGNAVRKIRIDLGVPIDFKEVPIFSKPLDPSGKERRSRRRGGYWAVGRIGYSCVDKDAPDGLLIYVKPAVYGHEPQDVLNYKRSHDSFPHETTADQFFDEPQFESYRALGSYIMDLMCGDDGPGPQPTTLEELAGRLYSQIDAKEEKDKWRWPTMKAEWLDDACLALQQAVERQELERRQQQLALEQQQLARRQPQQP
jgi:Patatin-like phospholipase